MERGISVNQEVEICSAERHNDYPATSLGLHQHLRASPQSPYLKGAPFFSCLVQAQSEYKCVKEEGKVSTSLYRDSDQLVEEKKLKGETEP